MNEIKKHWEQQASSKDTSTLKDLNLRSLEIEMIGKELQDGMVILDVGCGNGFSIRQWNKKVQASFVGVDYSEKMIDCARELLISNDLRNVSFVQGDVSCLPFADNFFDVVITERCLINIFGFEAKARALDEIYRVLKPDGKLLMMEATRQGLERLNQLRELVGLSTIKMAWHNDFFCEDWLVNVYFSGRQGWWFVERKNFATYYLISRVVHPLLVAPCEPEYATRINDVARLLSVFVPQRLDCSPHQFYVLQKHVEEKE